MADEWIKMRRALLTCPKVNGITKILELDSRVSEILFKGHDGAPRDVMHRNALRNVVVTALFSVWVAANDHTSDGVFEGADLDDIDDIAGLPGFAEAMKKVGWLIEDDDSITLPNFDEHNTCGKNRSRSAAAERQKRYREKKKAEQENRNASRYVTRDDREEKSREE